MYNPQDSINTAYDYIKASRDKGYKYGGYTVYDVSKSDLEELKRISDKYGIPFEWMINLIRHESAGTFNPAITNSIGATGLIQFMTKIDGKLMTYAKADGSSPVGTDKLRKMTFSEQLDYVDGFLSRGLKKHLTAEGKIPNNFTQGDVFMTIFYPVSVGKPDYKFSDKVANANAGIRTPMDYVEKALKFSIFPLSMIPYSLADVKKKFGEAFSESTKFAKRNFIPIVVVLIGLAGLGFFVYKKLKK